MKEQRGTHLDEDMVLFRCVVRSTLVVPLETHALRDEATANAHQQSTQRSSRHWRKQSSLLLHGLLDLLLGALPRAVARLGVDPQQQGVRALRQAVLELGGVLERMERYNTVVVVGGEEHRRGVDLRGVDVVQRRVPFRGAE